MIITHNMSAMNVNKRLSNVSKSVAKNAKKLSSGYKLNSASDDAAGLSISEKLRTQIRGLNRASHNAQDGISYIQVADGALGESQGILHRLKELSIQAANDTNTTSDRNALQSEIDHLTEELDRISKTTQFNTLDVFITDGTNSTTPVSGISDTGINEVKINVELNFVDSAGNPVSVSDSQAVGKDTSYADSDFATFIKKAAADAVGELYANFQNSLFKNASDTINVGLNLANIDGAGSTLASASLSMSYGSSFSTMAYTLNIDKSDYSIDDFDTMTAEKKADLAAVIAHEMTHLVMFDTVTDGMLSGNTESFPQWFIEGMAQTSSGDNGWMSALSPSSSDTDIKQYMSQMSSMPYGAGYLGTMYLGYAAATANASPSGNLRDDIIAGLNKIFTSLAEEKTLDEAIAENTLYSGLTDFENAFKNADAASLSFAKDFITAKDNGGGSLFASSLSESTSDTFSEANLTENTGNYIVNSDNTEYMNAYGTGYTFPPKASGIAGADDVLNLQTGALAHQGVQLEKYDVSVKTLFNSNTLDVSTFEKAGEAITTIDGALTRVSNIRSYYGAIQNRLEHIIANVENTAENSQAAESIIRDTDMAEEMVEYSKNNILMQAGQSLIVQANQSTQGIIQLLQT